ncbi:hypothetical protein D3C76_1797620 [compost metagenome]
MVESQNGKASGCSCGICTLKPSPCITVTAACVNQANTRSMLNVIRAMPTTHTAAQLSAFGNDSQRIFSSA